MNNLHEYNEFKNKKHVSTETETVNEGAQLFDDTWKVRTRIEIPTSLINSYIKKVKDETGDDPRKRWSEQEIAEEISKYVTTSYMTIENLPVNIIVGAQQEPKAQVQEQMPVQTQVQAQVEAPAETPTEAPVETTAQAPAQAPAQSPAQPVAPAQAVAQKVPQTEPKTAQI